MVKHYLKHQKIGNCGEDMTSKKKNEHDSVMKVMLFYFKESTYSINRDFNLNSYLRLK